MIDTSTSQNFVKRFKMRYLRPSSLHLEKRREEVGSSRTVNTSSRDKITSRRLNCFCDSYAVGPPEHVFVRRYKTQPTTRALREQAAPHRAGPLRTVSPPPSIRSVSSDEYVSSEASSSSSYSRCTRCLNFLVFGRTGVGKSTFIRTLLSHRDYSARVPRQGHTLESCTSEYEGFCYQTPEGQQVNLIDTPGFDDSRFSDAENLAKLARCLQKLHEQGQMIDGVIFINPVTDVRLYGAALKMAEVIRRVCGEQFFSRIALVTSMWDCVEPEHHDTAMRRHSMMLEFPHFWRDLHQEREGNDFMFKNGFQSANEVIQWLVKKSLSGSGKSPSLKMSQELQKGLLLSETAAGDFLLGELSKQKQKHVDTVAELRREIRKAQQSGDREFEHEITAEEMYEVTCAREVDSARSLLLSRIVGCH